MDPKVGLDQLAFQDHLELLDLKDLLDCLVIPVFQDQPEHKVSLVEQGQLVSLVRKVLKEVLAVQDHKASLLQCLNSLINCRTFRYVLSSAVQTAVQCMDIVSGSDAFVLASLALKLLTHCMHVMLYDTAKL